MSEIKKDFVEYFKNNNITFKGRDITEIFPEVLEPKRKKIVVEVEYDVLKGVDNIGVGLIAGLLERNRNAKVTELPGVFTREEMLEFKFGTTEFECDIWDKALDRFLSERNKK